ncbi:MAG: hypothetical protein HY819_11740 [Acidobacteria bacterium]|nr:hypothetical protein [Acidobacteriota bacterium]
MVKEEIPSYLIKKLTFFHCKRGPKRCYLCQEQRTEKICLLKICPSDGIIRRMIQVKIGSKNLLCEIDIIQVFNDATEATLFAKERNIALDIDK